MFALNELSLNRIQIKFLCKLLPLLVDVAYVMFKAAEE